MSDPPAPRVSIPLQSDARWIALGVTSTLAASNALFVWLFHGSRLPAALGLLPGMTVAIFAGSALAAWGRRRGGTLSLEANSHRVELREAAGRHEVLDLGAPYAAVLLRGRDDRRRMLVVSQRDEPTVLLERDAAADAPAEAAWADRAPETDLAHVAISPSSARVATVAQGSSLAPLLSHLASSVEPEAPWLLHPTPGGAPLRVDAREISLGSLAVPVRPGLKLLDYAIGPKGAAVAAVGVAGDEGALLLLGCEDAPVAKGAVISDLVPDAYLPMTGFEVFRAVVAAAVSEATHARRG